MNKKTIYGAYQQVYGGTQMSYLGAPIPSVGKNPGKSRFGDLDANIKGKRSSYDLYHASKGKINLSFPNKKGK